MTPFQIWSRITQVSYLLLLLLMILWPAVLYPPDSVPPWILSIILAFPLFFPFIGVLKQKLYTYAWLQFINMLYFCHAVMVAMSSDSERWIALIELALVLINFTAAIIAIRLDKKAREQEAAE